MALLPSGDHISFQEAVATFVVLAAILKHENHPLHCVEYPDIVLDPLRTSRLLTTFFTTDGLG